MKLKIKDLAFKTTDNYQYAEVLVNGKTGSEERKKIGRRYYSLFG
jgi:intein-encoded DNA endonuclease-like protein